MSTPVEEQLVVFGANDSHQLGLGEEDATEDVLVPRPAGMIGATVVAAMAFGSSHAVMLNAYGVVYTIGANHNGQCGVSSPELLITPVRLESLATSFTVTQIAAGGSHSAVVTQCGQLATFGANDMGQCGLGADAPLDVRKPRFVKTGSLAEVAQVACGDAHTLILDLGARVHACGQGRFGALGLGDGVTQTQHAPCTLSALAAAPIRMLAAGERHSVALTFGGGVLAWGWARDGALGLPHSASRSGVAMARPLSGRPGRNSDETMTADVVAVPRLVPSLRKGVQSIAAGGSHSLALLHDGTLVGFGRGASGGPPADSHTPVAITLPTPANAKVIQLSAGRTHSLALLEDGRVFSWGAAQSGQTGFGDTVDVPSPKLVPLKLDGPVRRVVAGGHSSALLLSDIALDSHVGLGGRSPMTISLEEIHHLTACRDWKTLASLVGAVFSSPALMNASFADEAAGGLRATLEPAHVALLRCGVDSAPGVLSALRDSIPTLLDALSGAIEDMGGEGPLMPPGLSRSASAKSTSFSSSTAATTPPRGGQDEQHMPRSPSSAAAAQRAYRDRYVLTPLATLLHNPLLSHASETHHLVRIATLVDCSLKPDGRHRLALMLAKQPADVFAARVVRPIVGAIERTLSSQRAGGDSNMSEVVALVRLLGLARDANEHARRRAAEAEAAAAPAAAGAGSSSSSVSPADGAMGSSSSAGSVAPGTIDPSEFYSNFLSEHLDERRDYVAWSQYGPIDRGTDPSGGWSFCSEPWVLNPQAKARLLQVEAAIKMGQSQQQAISAALGSGRQLDRRSVLGPDKRRRRAEDPATPSSPNSNRPDAPDPNSPFLILRVRRAHLVEDSLDVLARQTTTSLLKPLRVIFEGEPAIDEGGVRKEFFQLLIEQIFDPDFGMFDWLEEARCFWFSRTAAAVEAEAEFLLVGLVIGLAIHNGIILDLHFPQPLWLRLMNEPVGLSHLQLTHPDLWRGLRALLAFDGDVESTFMADFAVASEAFGAMTIDELVPNGSDTPVTNENRDEYTRLYADYLLVKSVQTQFDAFQKGFLLLCDGPAFSLLTPRELEQLACGVPHLDFQALQANAKYDAGFHPDHPTVKHFWEVVHSMGAEDQRALLFFATGCDRAPVGGLGKLQFVLQKAGPDSMDLPTAHTCFNLLAMPEYTSRAKLRDRLTIAIHNATGFGLQ